MVSLVVSSITMHPVRTRVPAGGLAGRIGRNRGAALEALQSEMGRKLGARHGGGNGGCAKVCRDGIAKVLKCPIGSTCSLAAGPASCSMFC